MDSVGAIETLLVIPSDSLHQAARLQCIGEDIPASGEEVRAPSDESSRERGHEDVGAKCGDVSQREATAALQVRHPVDPHMSKLCRINLEGIDLSFSVHLLSGALTGKAAGISIYFEISRAIDRGVVQRRHCRNGRGQDLLTQACSLFFVAHTNVVLVGYRDLIHGLHSGESVRKIVP